MEQINGYTVVLLMNVENHSTVPATIAEFEARLVAGRVKFVGLLPVVPPGSQISFGDKAPFLALREEGVLGNVGAIPARDKRSAFQFVNFENVPLVDPTTVEVEVRLRPVSGRWSRWCRRRLELKAKQQ
ncbi:MAG TPA: hypothetical protein VMD91_16295 [Candidatus Sulfotelmatobacter sp.]|nr:hypothetical protein [Candidatus Sulfotelmatobacter sp.]